MINGGGYDYYGEGLLAYSVSGKWRIESRKGVHKSVKYFSRRTNIAYSSIPYLLIL